MWHSRTGTGFLRQLLGGRRTAISTNSNACGDARAVATFPAEPKAAVTLNILTAKLCQPAKEQERKVQE